MIPISEYDYPLPDERIAKFPAEHREESKLLVYDKGAVRDATFSRIGEFLPAGALLVANDAKVIRARLLMRKETGAGIEIFCLEPHDPADYERAFAAHEHCEWSCMVGNSKKWKEGDLAMDFSWSGKSYTLTASRTEQQNIIRFKWNAPIAFGELLELLGRMPIPPYLKREAQEVDATRYQTVYSLVEGSVAAPTAGLHFTEDLIGELHRQGFGFCPVTLHVGAGTFLPVKGEDASQHEMHTEHFSIRVQTLRELIEKQGKVVAVGTTSTRCLESLAILGHRVTVSGDPHTERVVGQWEWREVPAESPTGELLEALLHYMETQGLESLEARTQIMIAPPYYKFRIVNALITNFHQPKSTLLLLVSAFTKGDWKTIYDHALGHDYRFLSYGDSSLLLP